MDLLWYPWLALEFLKLRNQLKHYLEQFFIDGTNLILTSKLKYQQGTEASQTCTTRRPNKVAPVNVPDTFQSERSSDNLLIIKFSLNLNFN